MKIDALEHRKRKRLSRALNISRALTVGMLEVLWQLTAREAKQGDIGAKFTDEDIACELDWPGDPEQLVTALVDTGWLDRHPEHRLLVHDWHEHAPSYVGASLARYNKPFLSNNSVPRKGNRPPRAKTESTEVGGSATEAPIVGSATEAPIVGSATDARAKPSQAKPSQAKEVPPYGVEGGTSNDNRKKRGETAPAAACPTGQRQAAAKPTPAATNAFRPPPAPTLIDRLCEAVTSEPHKLSMDDRKQISLMAMTYKSQAEEYLRQRNGSGPISISMLRQLLEAQP